MEIPKKFLSSFIVSLVLSHSHAYAEDAWLCKGGVSHVFPDGQQSYAQYYLVNHQRYPGDCFPQFCPAKCLFPTNKKPSPMKPGKGAAKKPDPYCPGGMGSCGQINPTTGKNCEKDEVPCGDGSGNTNCVRAKKCD